MEGQREGGEREKGTEGERERGGGGKGGNWNSLSS